MSCNLWKLEQVNLPMDISQISLCVTISNPVPKWDVSCSLTYHESTSFIITENEDTWVDEFGNEIIWEHL